MNMTAAARPALPSTSWTPPLDAEGLVRVVSALCGVCPLDAILDDVGDVLSNQAPARTSLQSSMNACGATCDDSSTSRSPRRTTSPQSPSMAVRPDFRPPA